MNVHHLELFYYVAKYEGITRAVRNMPYGIQQPAVSGQISKLEKSLGITLFQRRPFALTTAGTDLYNFIHPFFSRLEEVAAQLRGEETCHLRLAASAVALGNYLPEVLQTLQEEVPELRLTLREFANPELESVLIKQEADVALAILHRKTSPTIQSIKLLDLPLALAAPCSYGLSSFEELRALAKDGQLHVPLISLPHQEPVSHLFQRGLFSHSLKWEASMEISDLGLILNYVAKGFGFGVAVDIPSVAWPEGVNKIQLPADFPPLSLGALYSSKPKPVTQRFLQLVQAQAAQVKKALKKSGSIPESDSAS